MVIISMFSKDILNSNNLGSKNDDDALLYFGWEILAYTGTNHQEPLIEKVKQRFSGDGWDFVECDNRFFIHYNSVESDVEVVFKEIKYSNEESRKTEKYKITFKSACFSFRTKGEVNHQQLCETVFSRIPWKKRGFLIKEGNRFPILRKIRLRLKR
jgi:hypothetical protein